MREIATDGREVPHQRIRDDGGRVGEDRVPLADDGTQLEGGLPRERADPQLSVLLDVGEIRDPIEIDEELRLCEPELHQWDEALTAREELSLALCALQELDRMLQVRRDLVLEGCRDHRTLPLTA